LTLIVGSIALDSVESPFGKVDDSLGGAATYISIAASYFSKPVRVVAVVGGDFPKEHIELLKSYSVDTEGLQIIENGKTFRWGGKYHQDLNIRDTLFTNLNVFQSFNPVIPEKYKKTEYVCLGNIDPTLQRQVLSQIEKPKLVICDTMNYWIEGAHAELLKTLKLVDVLVLNDSEAKQLANEANLIRAAKIILKMGPSRVIIKKGEHGAMLITEKTVFSAPAYPLEDIFDPTGAGDSFAGGLIGWISKTDDISDDNLKRAILYGSTMASFCCEKFSVAGLLALDESKIQSRYKEFVNLSKIVE
jgi:sugar/nucleoside kinase (ribokinase family)